MQGTASSVRPFFDGVSSAIDRRIKYILLCPCIIFLLAIGIFPLLYWARLMFYDCTIATQRRPVCVGFHNLA
jgi:hypothetical protein